MAQLAGVGGQDCDETLVESGSYQVTAHPVSGPVVRPHPGRHVNARAPAGPVVSRGQTRVGTTTGCSQSYESPLLPTEATASASARRSV